MFNTKFVAYKRGSLCRLLDGCGAVGKSVEQVAYLLWEKSGKPEGQSEYFWHEAEKIVNPKPASVRETDFVCSSCGHGCFFDGRCGDGPVRYCHCWGGGAIPRSEYLSDR